MAKKYENMGTSQTKIPETKKRFTLNPFENLYRKDGKGVDRDELNVLEKPGIANFFKLLRRRLNHIFSVNLLILLGNFPLLFALFALAYTTREAMAPSSQLYAALQGAALFDSSPVLMSVLGVYGLQDTVAVPTTLTYVFVALSALVLFTFGPVNVGTTYILRNIVRGEPVFIWSDFWYAIRRNLKQGILFGIIDLAVMGILVYDMTAYRLNLGTSQLFMLFYFLSFAMMILYFFVRMYVYPMIVTFDMSLWKMIKNSIFFAVLGVKRNIMALLGTVTALGLNYFLLRLYFPLGLILPFIILIGFLGFLCNYVTFPKIKEIMIDPYYKEVEEDGAATER